MQLCQANFKKLHFWKLAIPFRWKWFLRGKLQEGIHSTYDFLHLRFFFLYSTSRLYDCCWNHGQQIHIECIEQRYLSKAISSPQLLRGMTLGLFLWQCKICQTNWHDYWWQLEFKSFKCLRNFLILCTFFQWQKIHKYEDRASSL